MGYGYDFDPMLNSEVGCGVATHLKALLEVFPESSIQLIDDSSARRTIVATTTGYQSLSLHDALQQDRDDFLGVVAVPTSEHLIVIRKYLQSRNCMSLIVEKPSGGCLRDSISIVETVAIHGVASTVNFFRSTLPHVQHCKEYLKTLDEEIREINIWGYGSLTNIFSHFIHLLGTLTNFDLLNVASVKSASSHYKAILQSGVSLNLFNLGGERSSKPILEIVFDSVRISVRANGAQIIAISLCDNSQIRIWTIDDFQNYQRYALQHHLDFFSGVLATSPCEISSAVRVHSFFDQLWSSL
jgi:hypothetical protein